ncbi:MAG: PilZ domain-containing protein [Nitrospiraceae bacterium]|nr:MAG: PilZ domain-containing protein [Nitrospiraceae bacterium]
MHADNRKDSRRDKFLIAEYKLRGNRGSYSLGTVRNLSPEGFSLDTQVFPFERGQVLEFRLTHSRNDPAVEVAGEVVWKKQAWFKNVSGIRLLHETEDTRSRIGALMTAVEEDWNDAGVGDESPERVQSGGDHAPVPLQKEERPEVLSPHTVAAGGSERGELPEQGGNRKSALYAALAAVVIFLLLVLPGAVKKLTPLGNSDRESIVYDSRDRGPGSELPAPAADHVSEGSGALTESTVQAETERPLSREAIQEKEDGDAVSVEKEGLNSVRGAGIASDTGEGKDFEAIPENQGTEDLIGRINRTLASVREIEKEERRKENTAPPEGGPTADSAALSETWVPVGDVREGMSLFIHTATVSHPGENIMKLLVKTVDEEREFIDLIEIDCARSLLRVIDGLSSDNPATSAYSRQWQDIVPESEMLRDAACSRQE